MQRRGSRVGVEEESMHHFGARAGAVRHDGIIQCHAVDGQGACAVDARARQGLRATPTHDIVRRSEPEHEMANS